MAWEATPRSLDNGGHEGEEGARTFTRSSTLDSSVAGEGSPALDPESPRETGVGRTSQDTLLFWWKRETPFQVDPRRAKRGPLGSGTWRPTWEGRGGRGWEHEGGVHWVQE